MSDRPIDGFDRYYAEKIWELVPATYRLEDGVAENPGVLRAMVEVLATQAAIVRRSNDRLWQDQSIDTADDWAVPYLGDLVGTRMVAALNTRGRRVDVSSTIYYRRRAGTLIVLDGLVSDITGWDGVVVEEFRRLVRHPHALDEAPAARGGVTGTPAYGFADLRKPRGAKLVSTPFDEYSHLPDVRRHHGGIGGRYSIGKVGIHYYRHLSLRITASTPHELAADALGNKRFSFDPSGREIPLYQRAIRTSFGDDWRPALEWEVPAPMTCEVLGDAVFLVTEALITGWRSAGTVTAAQAGRLRTLTGIRCASESRLRVRLASMVGGLSAAATTRIVADSLIEDCGKGVLLPSPQPAIDEPWSVGVTIPSAGTRVFVTREQVAAGGLSGGSRPAAGRTLIIDPQHGLGYFTAGATPAGAEVSYQYGFPAPIGAGPHERTASISMATPTVVSGGGAIPAPAAAADLAVRIDDNATYSAIADLSATTSIDVAAASGRRPYLELSQDWTITATAPDTTLRLQGLWLGGRAPRAVRLAATAGSSWGEVVISGCTFDPGGVDADAAPLGPVSLAVDANVQSLLIESCVLGPLAASATARIDTLSVRDSIVQSRTAAPAITQPEGTTDLLGCTVFGELALHRLEATNVVCTGIVTVDDTQAGCIRFSAYPTGSQTPRSYRCVEREDFTGLFASRRFGDPDFAELSAAVPDEIRTGGESGTEMGAYASMLNPIKLDSLRAKIDEFLPFGLIPLYLKET